MSDVFNTINTRKIRWIDGSGAMHAVEGSEVHPGIRLLWTKCEKDVPANTAFLSEEPVTCDTCKAKV